MKLHIIHACLFACGALSACAAVDPVKSDHAQLDVDRQILEAAQKIQAAQERLYQAGAFSPVIDRQPAPIVDDKQRLAIAWKGDAAQLLKKMARDRGLAFTSVGVRMPLPVRIDSKDTSFDAVLDQLRAQICYRADIDQAGDRLVLQYHKPQR
jgi:defect-in-organelle-trafficking protein DotD